MDFLFLVFCGNLCRSSESCVWNWAEVLRWTRGEEYLDPVFQADRQRHRQTSRENDSNIDDSIHFNLRYLFFLCLSIYLKISENITNLYRILLPLYTIYIYTGIGISYHERFCQNISPKSSRVSSQDSPTNTRTINDGVCQLSTKALHLSVPSSEFLPPERLGRSRLLGSGIELR